MSNPCPNLNHLTHKIALFLIIKYRSIPLNYHIFEEILLIILFDQLPNLLWIILQLCDPLKYLIYAHVNQPVLCGFEFLIVIESSI